MKDTAQSFRIFTLSTRIGVVFGTLLALAFLFAAPASASIEQVGSFAESGEAAQLGDSNSIAVNRTGAGGVPPGTLYLASGYGRVTRYSPKGELREVWGVTVSEPPAGGGQFERCGPDGEPAHPLCNTRAKQQTASRDAIAVDQATGNVYVLSNGQDQIEVRSPDGSQLIAKFGESSGSPNPPIEETPEKFHTLWEDGLAVDDSGTVYVSDFSYGDGIFRIMVFQPQTPGDYEHYVYTGRANDIATSAPFKQSEISLALAVDAAGRLYTVRGQGVAIAEFVPGEPDSPACEYQAPSGGILAITVNQLNGEVFYFTFKDKKIHQLSPCNEQGKFEEQTVIPVTPKTDGIEGLAFNPSLTWEGSRPAGILYATDRGNAGTGPRLVDVFASAEVHLPVVESEAVSSVTSSTATLHAQINPKGSATSYVFQYITRAAYEANAPGERFAGASDAPSGGALLGTGQETLSAAASLVGLASDTEYHYRVIATSHCSADEEEEICEDTGIDRVFHTFPVEAPGLADNRAWELVSPVQKSGGEVFPLDPSRGSCAKVQAGCKPGGNTTENLVFPKQSSPNGEAVAYEGFPFSATEGAAIFNEYIAKRTGSGWQTMSLAPAPMSVGGGYTAFDSALTQSILYQTPPSLTPEAPSEYANLYAQPTADPSSLTPLLSSEPPNRSSALVADNQFRLAYVGASDDLTHQFFEANDALTGETPFAPEAVDGGVEILKGANLYESVDGNLRLVNVLPGNAETVLGAHFAGPDLPHSISDDGSRAFWSDPAGQLYVRIDGESTTEIPDPGKYLTASDDGSKVMLNNGHLYDLETETTTDLTEGKGGFQGIAGQSDDLSHIYFVDTAVLTGEEENDQGAKAQAGKGNLYSWAEGESTFAAALDATPSLSFDGSTWDSSPATRTAEGSPGGRWLAFQSVLPLTGYDNVGPTCGRDGFGKYFSASCNEAFLYDSQSGALLCVSCNPSGARPLGKTRLPVRNNRTYYLSPPRYLADSGRLYFDTQDSLTPFDTNRALEGPDSTGKPSGAGEAGAEDVYQYEPEGVGVPPCKREAGCVSLISAGHEADDSNFFATDETGKNVFFTTRDQLVLKDTDDLMDLYVAREGGGIASETETARGECQGEACQPQVSPPNDPTPGSSSFEGAGNVDEKKTTKKHKHKKHKHAKRHKSSKRAHGRASHNRGGVK
jgi:hypothetical protein